jgi:hypothetical protein
MRSKKNKKTGGFAVAKRRRSPIFQRTSKGLRRKINSFGGDSVEAKNKRSTVSKRRRMPNLLTVRKRKRKIKNTKKKIHNSVSRINKKIKGGTYNSDLEEAILKEFYDTATIDVPTNDKPIKYVKKLIRSLGTFDKFHLLLKGNNIEKLFTELSDKSGGEDNSTLSTYTECAEAIMIICDLLVESIVQKMSRYFQPHTSKKRNLDTMIRDYYSINVSNYKDDDDDTKTHKIKKIKYNTKFGLCIEIYNYAVFGDKYYKTERPLYTGHHEEFNFKPNFFPPNPKKENFSLSVMSFFTSIIDDKGDEEIKNWREKIRDALKEEIKTIKEARQREQDIKPIKETIQGELDIKTMTPKYGILSMYMKDNAPKISQGSQEESNQRMKHIFELFNDILNVPMGRDDRRIGYDDILLYFIIFLYDINYITDTKDHPFYKLFFKYKEQCNICSNPLIKDSVVAYWYNATVNTELIAVFQEPYKKNPNIDVVKIDYIETVNPETSAEYISWLFIEQKRNVKDVLSALEKSNFDQKFWNCLTHSKYNEIIFNIIYETASKDIECYKKTFSSLVKKNPELNFNDRQPTTQPLNETDSNEFFDYEIFKKFMNYFIQYLESRRKLDETYYSYIVKKVIKDDKEYSGYINYRTIRGKHEIRSEFDFKEAVIAGMFEVNHKKVNEEIEKFKNKLKLKKAETYQINSVFETEKPVNNKMFIFYIFDTSNVNGNIMLFLSEIGYKEFIKQKLSLLLQAFKDAIKDKEDETKDKKDATKYKKDATINESVDSLYSILELYYYVKKSHEDSDGESEEKSHEAHVKDLIRNLGTAVSPENVIHACKFMYYMCTKYYYYYGIDILYKIIDLIYEYDVRTGGVHEEYRNTFIQRLKSIISEDTSNSFDIQRLTSDKAKQMIAETAVI